MDDLFLNNFLNRANINWEANMYGNAQNASIDDLV